MPVAGADQFSIEGIAATFQFTHNANQQVTGITLAARGQEFDGRKNS